MQVIAPFSADDLVDKQVRQVEVDGRAPIAVYRLGDELLATDDICTHEFAFLSEGEIEGGEIICPFHLGAFDIRTGEATVAPCVDPLVVYPVTVDAAGRIIIDLG